MKIVSKIALLIGMFVVLGLSFVLPKFVQRTSPPEPETDLAEVLAKVDDVQSSENSSGEAREEELATLKTIVNDQQSASSIDNLITSFESDVESGKLKSAEQVLERLSPSLDSSTHQKLAAKLSIAKKASTDSSIANPTLPSGELSELKKLQEKSLAELRASVKELNEATQAAKKAASAAKSVEPSAISATPRTSEKEMVLPETISVAFDPDSTVLSEKGQGLISPAVKFLKNEPALSVQLRGYSDKKGSSEYNASLSQARCEIVRDFLLEQGVSGKKISVISFGETQASVQNDKNARRVDLVFREM